MWEWASSGSRVLRGLELGVQRVVQRLGRRLLAVAADAGQADQGEHGGSERGDRTDQEGRREAAAQRVQGQRVRRCAGDLRRKAVDGERSTGLDVTDPSLVPMVAPTLLIGVGFALSVSSFTAVAINTVPLHLAGMASAATNLLRDLGFALGPIIVGAVALSSAGDRLGTALATADLPADQAGPANGVFQAGGALALNGLPPNAPGAAAHPLALQALGDGYSTAFLVCAIAALAAAVLTLVGLREDPAAPSHSPARGGSLHQGRELETAKDA